MVEALVAVGITALAVSSLVGALAGMTRANRLAIERERVHTLAHEKFEELRATGDFRTVASGDFSDRNVSGFAWTAERLPTGTENLEIYTVTVRSTALPALQAQAQGLMFVPPQQTGEEAQAQ